MSLWSLLASETAALRVAAYWRVCCSSCCDSDASSAERRAAPSERWASSVSMSWTLFARDQIRPGGRSLVCVLCSLCSVCSGGSGARSGVREACTSRETPLLSVAAEVMEDQVRSLSIGGTSRRLGRMRTWEPRGGPRRWWCGRSLSRCSSRVAWRPPSIRAWSRSNWFSRSVMCARDSTKDSRFLDCAGISWSSAVVVLACASIDPSLDELYWRFELRRLCRRCSRLIVSFGVAGISSNVEETGVSASPTALRIDSSGRWLRFGFGFMVRYCSICENALAMVRRDPGGDRGVVPSITAGRGNSGMRDSDAVIPARRI